MLDSKALFDSAWAEEVSNRRRQSPSYEVGDYTATGRAAAKYGNKRGLEWWADNGHTLVDNWIAWRKAHPDFISWVTPDGIPAIELELRVNLPGDIEVLMFVDNIFVNTKTGEIVVMDKKSGRTPETEEQLGLYATGVELKYGKAYRPHWGYWWDANKGEHSKPMSLERWTPEVFARMYRQAIDGINAGSFLPSPANGCGKGGAGWCGVARFCAATGGPDAAGVDPLLSA